MAGAPSVPARVLEASVRIDSKLGQTEEDDARALLKADFDKGIATLRSGDDRVDATCLPDPLPVRIGEVIRLRALTYGDRSADQHIGFLHCAYFQAKAGERRNYRAAMYDPLLVPRTFVACAFKDRESTAGALRSLLDLGVTPEQIGIGAIGAHRADAEALGAQFGVRSDVDGEDPLAGVPGLASAAESAANVNRGALIGGAVGAFAGVALSFVPGFPIISTEPHYRALAGVLLFFILGALAGATLGGAFAPQRSTHAAFRIVDEIEHGGLAVVVAVDTGAANAVQDALTAARGLHATRIPPAARAG